MATLQIPIPAGGSTAFSFSILLSKKIYSLLYRYNRRDAHWIMDIGQAGTIIVSGIKVVTGIDLFNQYRNRLELPLGSLFTEPITTSNDDPDEFTFGKSILLKYMEPV